MSLIARVERRTKPLRHWLRGRGRPALVLLYHRVAQPGIDPPGLCVSSRHFAEQMEVIRRHFRPCSLGEIAGRTEGRSLAPRSIGVTFDDGYADNLHAARPTLDRFEVPATIFVATENLGSDREFWWDWLAQVLLHAEPLPETLPASVAGSAIDTALGAAVRGDARTERLTLYRQLQRWLKGLPAVARDRLIDALADWAGVAPKARATHRVVDEGELARLCDGRLVEAGAHTVAHPALAGLTPEACRAEIAEGRDRLAAILGRPIDHFAYPYGDAADCADETVAVLRGLGLRTAATSLRGSVVRGTDPLRLPRHAVHDYDGGELERRLRRWLRA